MAIARAGACRRRAGGILAGAPLRLGDAAGKAARRRSRARSLRGRVRAAFLRSGRRGEPRVDEVIGSWKIIAISLPRSARSASGASVSNGLPSNRVLPETCAIGGSRRRMARESMVLPEPDSPTTPSALPCSSRRLTPASARSGPRAVGSSTERLSTSSSAKVTRRAAGRSGSAAIADEVKDST